MSDVRSGALVGSAVALMMGLAGLAVAMPGVAAADNADNADSTSTTSATAHRDHTAARAGAHASSAGASAAVRSRSSAARKAAVPRPAAVTATGSAPACAETSNKNCSGKNFGHHPMTNVDLSGVNFRDSTLYGDLSNANFTRAVLQDTKLIRLLGRDSANVTGANFTDANLIGIRDLRSVTGFNTATLTGANLYEQNLDGVALTGKNLTRANLYGATLKKAALNGADLTGADLTLADLTGANLETAVLKDADLNWADLTGANLRGIRNLKAVKGFGTATLTGANLSDQDLAGVLLNDEDLSKANLAGADLSGADLAGADLTDAIITRANLTEANLTGAKIGNTTWALTDYKFVQVKYTGALGVAPSTLAFIQSDHTLGSFTMSDNPGLRPFVQTGDRPGKGGGLKFSIDGGDHTASFYQDSSGQHFRINTVQETALAPGRESEIYNRLVFTFTIDQSVDYNYRGESYQNQVYLLPGDVDAAAKFFKVPEPMPDWPTLSPGPNQIPSSGTLRPGTYTFWVQTKGSKQTIANLDLRPILE